MKTKFIVMSAIIAAVYTVLSCVFMPISFGPVQLRVSEALTVLPILTPTAIPGLTIGCILSNLIGGFGPIDVIFGSLATLLAAVFTWIFRKKTFFALLSPVVFNALIVGTTLYFLVPESPAIYINMLTVGAGELVACFVLGYALLYVLRKYPQIFE